LKRLPAAFYELPSGRAPVREWLKGLDRPDRKIIGEDIKDVEFSWPIGMPLCRAWARLVGSAQRDYAGSDCPRAVLREWAPNGAAAWLRQEDSKDAGQRLEIGG
jgi:hypothetical protein